MTYSMRLFIYLLLVTFMLTACSTRVMSPEETAEISSKTYRAVTPQAILSAASDLFFLADDQAFQRTLEPDQLVAVREHSFNIGLNLVQSLDTWNISTHPDTDGTKVTLDVKSEESWITGKTQVQRPNGPAVYTQFWNRLDYLLGQSTKWMSCGDLNHEYLEDRTWGDVWWLCSDVQDRLPPELMTGIWQNGGNNELSPEVQQRCMNKVLDGLYGIADSQRQQDLYLTLCLEEEGYRLFDEHF